MSQALSPVSISQKMPKWRKRLNEEKKKTLKLTEDK